MFGYDDCLDLWAAVEDPPAELRILVVKWLMSRLEDPHRGVKRVRDFPNLWFGKVAESDHGSGAAVWCTYEIDEANRRVHLRAVSTLNNPV
ncbi:hypothetical protein ACGFIW_01350 [Micromonospora sp. NPDC048935]|uniref:hypothetical protein n=1 Tax=Micromonospora sp. NPDC048935 TaxID=3364262 RepID=UPI00372287D9